MKKILAMAAVAALAAGASVYAANPFSDVSTSDWAYQAVADLSDQGVVEGYPDGTFKGENNITRYEMAQIIARLMAKEDQLNAEQRATVDKLAGEYADELDNLGVRVSNLEKKVGNIAWSGDARLRYSDSDSGKGSDGYTARIRINARATVNDSTYAHLRLSTGNVDLKKGDDADVVADRLYVHHDFADAFGVTAGKYEVDAGSQNAWLYSQTFNGAEAQFKLGDVALKAGYGRFDPDEYTKLVPAKFYENNYEDVEFGYAQAAADLGFAKVNVDYFKANDNVDYEVVGGGVSVPVGSFNVFGDYYANTAANNDPSTWTAGLGYKAPKWDLSVAYFDVEDDGVTLGSLTGWQAGADHLTRSGNFLYATGNVALAKGVTLHTEYAFNSDADNGQNADDSWTVSLNYKF